MKIQLSSILIFVVCFICCAEARDVKVLAKDAADFFGGLTEGLGLVNSTELNKCELSFYSSKEGSDFPTSMNKFSADLQVLYKHRSVTNFMNAVNDAASLVDAGKKLYVNCKNVPQMGPLKSELEQVSSNVRSQLHEGWRHLAEWEFDQLSGNVEILLTTAKTINFNFKNGHFLDAGRGLGALLNSFLRAQINAPKLTSVNFDNVELYVEDALHLVAGFTNSLGLTNSDVLLKCVDQADRDLASDVRHTLRALMNAYKEKSKFEFMAALGNVSEVVNDVEELTKVCKNVPQLKNFEKELKQFSENFKSELKTGWANMLKGQLVEIFSHGDVITAKIQMIEKEIENSNFEKVGQLIGDLVNLFLKPSQFQSSNNNQPIFGSTNTVMEDVEVLGKVFEGILEGLHLSTAGNLHSCFDDAHELYDHLRASIVVLKNAFHKKKISLVENAFTTMSVVVSDFHNVMSDCSTVVNYKDLAKRVSIVVTKLEVHHGWLAVLKNEGFTIWKNRNDLAHDCVDVYNAFESKKYVEAGRALGDVINKLLPSAPSTIVTLRTNYN